MSVMCVVILPATPRSSYAGCSSLPVYIAAADAGGSMKIGRTAAAAAVAAALL